MKRRIQNCLVFANLFFLVSCHSVLSPEYPVNTPFQINFGELGAVYLNDIEYYDQSAHLFYLKKALTIVPENLLSFWITSGNDLLLQGFYSQKPLSTCTNSFLTLLYGGNWNYPLILELNYDIPQNLSYFHTEILPDNPEFLAALQRNKKLMKGLNVSIVSIERISATNLKLNLEIYNADSLNYYYPDVDKMGFDFFHGVFSNIGLKLYANDSTHYYNHSTLAKYGNDELWYPSWLSLIKSGETKQMQINYSNYDSIQPGHYYALFEFNGLKQHIHTTREMTLDSGRVWLGSKIIAEEIDLK